MKKEENKVTIETRKRDEVNGVWIPDTRWNSTANVAPLARYEINLLTENVVDLIVSQFNQLQQHNIEAYRLLCRLGCYRYQNIPSLPIQGVVCLSWDIPQSQQQQIIDELINRSLLECSDNKYLLHSLIREEATARLRGSQYFRSTHIHAAEFWINSVENIETLNDILWSLEACYHYQQSNNLELVEKIRIK